jgi:hypothetical protein
VVSGLSFGVAFGAVVYGAGLLNTNGDIDYSRSSKFPVPKYASVKEMQIVSLLHKNLGCRTLSQVIRLSKRFEKLSETTVSVLMMRISSYMATQNGLQRISRRFLLLLYTQSQQRKCLSS